MKLDQLKSEFLAFAHEYNDDDLNLLLNYIYLLLENFEHDPNLLEIVKFTDFNENKTNEKSTLFESISKRSLQITDKLIQYELLGLENSNLFMDAELTAVITNEANEAASQSMIKTTLVTLTDDLTDEIAIEENDHETTIRNKENNEADKIIINSESENEQEIDKSKKPKNSRKRTPTKIPSAIILRKYQQKSTIKKQATNKLKTKKRNPKSTKSIKYPTYVVTHLTKEYNENRYPNSKKIKEIALETKLTLMQVSKWFTDRRSKLKHTKSNKIPTHAVNQFIKVYNKNKYPNAEEIKQLEAETKVNYEQIFNWFRTRRHKLKQTEKKDRKKPNVLPKHVTNYLIDKYNENKNPIRTEIEEMALQLHLTTEKVNNWFKKRRIQLKETKPSTIPNEVLGYLIDKYALNKYPNSEMIQQMSSEINLGTEQIFNWFRTRRQRLKETKQTKYPPEIINYMIQKFNVNFYPSSVEIQQMALETNLTIKQVNQWFSDRRFKFNHTVIKPIEVSIQDGTPINQLNTPVKINEKKRRAPRQQSTPKTNGFPAQVVDYLNDKFNKNNYPTPDEIKQMITDTGLSKRQINQWFNDKRYRSNRTKSNKYPEHVINYLLEKFDQNNYPSTEEKHKIALDTKLTTQQVNKWFEDRRYKSKRFESKSEEISSVNLSQTSLDQSFQQIL